MTQLICKLLGHKVNRKRVWNDTRDYRTNCERCDAPLLRDIEAWREFVPEDHRPDRLPHPSQRA
jgi:hypothetical protein